MQLYIHALKNGLVKEKEVYSQLLRLARNKTEALIKNDLETIEAILKSESEALKKLGELNTLQTGTLSKIAEKMALSQQPNLSEIIEMTDNEQDRQTLVAIQNDFHTLIKELRTQNEQNQRLLETQLQYTSFCIELMTQNDAVGDLYGSSGHINEDPTPRRGFINREA